MSDGWRTMCLATDVTRPRRVALSVRPLVGGALVALLLAALPQAARADCVGAAEDLPSVACRSASLTAAWAEVEGKLAEIAAAHPDRPPPQALRAKRWRRLAGRWSLKQALVGIG